MYNVTKTSCAMTATIGRDLLHGEFRQSPTILGGVGAPSAQGQKRRLPLAMCSAGVALILMGLSGCMGAQVTSVATAYTAARPPVEILLDVGPAPATAEEAGPAQVVAKVADKLQSDLVQQLTEAGITAEPAVPGTSHPGAAVLHVGISDADPGNAVARFIVGFGAGRAELRVAADLETTNAAGTQAVTAFDTYADSGRMPGLILPGGAALATGKAIHLAIGGGIKLATSLNDGLDKPVRETATAIIGQLKQYYTSVGWYWPASTRA